MHHKWLLRTLELAKAHKGFCAPNPAVGAIVVKNDQEISCGSHTKPGEAHAEIHALTQLTYPLIDATLYISLEPCSHWGKTPPCVDEIVRSGVSKVVFSHVDPNPIMMSFDTIGYLAEKGIDCEQIVLPEINDFYSSYDYWTKHKRPLVTFKLAQSLDGKIALAGNKPCHLTDDNLAQFTHQQRMRMDGILTTASTILADNPQLNVRLPGEPVIEKPLAILDTNARLTGKETVFEAQAKRYRFCNEDAKLTSATIFCQYISIAASSDGVDLNAVLDHLGRQGWHDVWVEAGGKLFASMMQHGLINQLYLFIAPCWLGCDAIDSYPLAHQLDDDRIEAIAWQTVSDQVMAKITLKQGRQ